MGLVSVPEQPPLNEMGLVSVPEQAPLNGMGPVSVPEWPPLNVMGLVSALPPRITETSPVSSRRRLPEAETSPGS